MTKKMLWLAVSSLMALSLLMAACGPAATPTAPTAPTTPTTPTAPTTPAVKEAAGVTGKEMVANSLGKLAEKPKYGGKFTLLQTSSPQYWDEALSTRMSMWGTMYTNETLLIGDWAKGPTGSGEVGWKHVVSPEPSIMTGWVAESWAIVDDQTIEFKIRKGIHFHNKPPTNGRELNANDVVYSLLRIAKSSNSFVGRTSPLGRDLISVTAPDKWTVIFKTNPGQLFLAYYSHLIQGGNIIPQEAIERYGDMQNWRNLVGSGPFILTDYVNDSIATYVKNSDYWMKDPLFPENTLPYVDELAILIIPDRSTQQAAFRTGRLDTVENTLLEEKQFFEKTNPQMLWTKFLPDVTNIVWKVDTAPFNDIRVRRALWMAVDRKSIVDNLYRGDAELENVVYPIPELKRYFTPLKELPESTQEIYVYNPDKARKLLAEAGYPQGFKAEVTTGTAAVDMLSIVKDYWKAVGVDIQMKVLESGALSGVILSRTYQLLAVGGSPYRPESFTMYAAGQEVNRSQVNDPIINEARLTSSATFLTDPAKNAQIVKDTMAYINGQAFIFHLPTPYQYIGWHPWVKNYSGEYIVGGRGHRWLFPMFVWVDQDLKKSFGR